MFGRAFWSKHEDRMALRMWRMIPVAVCAIMAGCVISWLVAIVAVWASDGTAKFVRSRGAVEQNELVWHNACQTSFGVDVVSCARMPLRAIDPQLPVVEMPAWSTGSLSPDSPTVEPSRDPYCEVASGWPFRAFYSSHSSEYTALPGGSLDRIWITRWGIPMFDRKRDHIPPPSIPFMPIWAGLIADTVLWGAIASALVGICRRILMRLRRGRGQCAVCGYEMQELASCPECGTAR